MNDYEELPTSRSISAANNELLTELARNVREVRRTLEGQGSAIADLRVSVGRLEAEQTGIKANLASIAERVMALTKEGRAETYIDTRAILQALGMALALLAVMGGIYWIGRL